MNLLLRPARENEAGDLTALALRSKRAWGYDDAFMEAVMPDMIVHAEYLREEHGIIAEYNGKLVGYAIVRVDGNAAFLREFFVDPQHFRQGIGGALFEAAASYGRQQGASDLVLRLSLNG